MSAAEIGKKNLQIFRRKWCWWRRRRRRRRRKRL